MLRYIMGGGVVQNRRPEVSPFSRFGAEMWRECFGVSLVDDDYRIPAILGKVLEESSHSGAPIKIRDRYDIALIPAKVNGVPFNLKMLQELVARRGIRIAINDHTGECGDIVNCTFKVISAYWMLMQKAREVTLDEPKKKVLEEKYPLSICRPTVLEGATIVVLKALGRGLDDQERFFIQECREYKGYATRLRVDSIQQGNVSLTISIGDLHGGRNLRSTLETRHCIKLR